MQARHAEGCWRLHMECCLREAIAAARAATANEGFDAVEAKVLAAGTYFLGFGRAIPELEGMGCPAKARAGRKLYACSLAAGHVGRCEFQL